MENAHDKNNGWQPIPLPAPGPIPFEDIPHDKKGSSEEEKNKRGSMIINGDGVDSREPDEFDDDKIKKW
jgi:hypothetical protein